MDLTSNGVVITYAVHLDKKVSRQTIHEANKYIVDVVREPVDLELLSSKIAQDIGTSMSAVNLWSLLLFLFNISSISSSFSGYFSSK